MLQFGDWQLRRSDPLNLKLYHRHEAQKGRSKGKVDWYDTGHYFQSVRAGVAYALNAEVLERVGDESFIKTLREAIDEEKALVAEFKEWLSEARISSGRPD